MKYLWKQVIRFANWLLVLSGVKAAGQAGFAAQANDPEIPVKAD